MRSQFSVPELRGKECSVVRHLAMIMRFSPRPPAWRPCQRRSPGRVERSPRQGSGFPAHSQDDSLSSSPDDSLSSSLTLPLQLTRSPSQHLLAHSLTLSALYPEDGVVIYRSPSAGRGLGEADVTVHPDWTGLPWGHPFWAGFQPYREARPLTACSDSPKRNYCRDSASENESPVRRVGEHALVQPMRE